VRGEVSYIVIKCRYSNELKRCLWEFFSY